jgi:predicted aldo/keto reductase-like oxidoreductase
LEANAEAWNNLIGMPPSTLLMRRRVLGRTGLDISPVSFGAITLRQLDEEATGRLVREAIGRGINYFDTAHSYADTSRKLGSILPDVRDDIRLGTKVLDRGEAEAYDRLISSLDDLRVDSTDIMWLHAVDLEETLDEVLGERGALHAILRCREEGLTRFTGITGHRPDILAQAVKRFPFDAVMTPVNYLYRFSFGAEAGLIPLCLSRGVGIVAIKPRAYQRLPDMLTAYNYVLSQGAATIIPHGSVAELTAAMELMERLRDMTATEVEQILGQSPELEGHCRQCGYCQPCPQGIDIPLILKLSDMWHGPHRVTELNPGYAVQAWSRKTYLGLHPKADACDSCAACEARCPHSVEIIRELKDAHRKLASGIQNGQ